MAWLNSGQEHLVAQEAVDAETAKLTPDAVFSRPLDVVNAPHLTQQQKIAALERWSLMLEDQLRATDEGMSPPAGQTAAEAAAVEEVAAAIKLVKGEQPAIQL
jgi:hypothetical protein